MMGIYAIVHLATSRCYIGQSKDIPVRFQRHRSTLRKGTHHNHRLQEAWDKYGEDAFSFDVLLEVPDEIDLDALEEAFISAVAEFNISERADRVTFTSEVRAKMSASAKRAKKGFHPACLHTPEAREKLRLARKAYLATPEGRAMLVRKGTNISDETRRKMRESALARVARLGSPMPKGGTLSPEARAKISAKAKGRKATDDRREQCRIAALRRKRTGGGQFA